MPIELVVSFSDGTSEMYYIPNDLLFGYKKFDTEVNYMESWNWASTEYEFKLEGLKKVVKIEIDPSKRLADFNQSDNIIEIPK